MSETKHTPTKGPWRVINTTGKGAAVYCDKMPIATVYDVANVSLIAVSPQLLERLKRAVEILRDSTDVAMETGLVGLDEWLVNVRADIAEAEGGR